MKAIMNKKNSVQFLAAAFAALITLGAGCTSQSSGPSGRSGSAGGGSDKGVGPVSEVKLSAVDVDLASKGKTAFTAKCSACHKIDERFVGPALKGVTQRRTPEWIMNMILNPQEMTQKDPTAKGLLGEYMTQMTFQNVSQDEARQILEFFRQTDSAAK